MFLLYPIVAGIAVGLITGGHLSGLETIRIRWAPLALAALVVQVLLFSPLVNGWIGAAGPPIYVVSTAAVVVVAARNGRQVGLLIVAVGGALNLLAIVANGGYMPADPGALAALGQSIDPATYGNSAPGGAGVVLRPLTDIFAMPAGLPGANIFSIGDALIALGVFVWLVVALHHREVGPRAADEPERPAGSNAPRQGTAVGATESGARQSATEELPGPSRPG